MAQGQKTGGRKPGSQSQKRKALSDLIEAAVPGFDPVVWLSQLAAGVATEADGSIVEVTLDQRIMCAKEVAQYVRPKLKAIEHSGPGGGVIPVAITPADALL